MKTYGIELTFLVPGHSHNENDTTYSVIESHNQNRFTYTPSQWGSTIQQVFKMNFCHVPALNFDDILDFKSPLNFSQYVKKLADKCFPEALDSKKKVKKVMQSEIVQLETIEDNRDIMHFKCNCDND